MTEKLFGETPEEQYRYLKSRLTAAAAAIIVILVGMLLELLHLDFGGAVVDIGTILLASVMLVFG